MKLRQSMRFGNLCSSIFVFIFVNINANDFGLVFISVLLSVYCEEILVSSSLEQLWEPLAMCLSLLISSRDMTNTWQRTKQMNGHHPKGVFSAALRPKINLPPTESPYCLE